MNRSRWLGIAALLAMASPAVEARPDGKGSPAQVIRDKGLEIVRGRLVLAEESKAIRAAQEAREALAEFQEAIAACSEIVDIRARLDGAQQLRTDKELELRDVQLQIDELNRNNRGYRGSINAGVAADLKVAENHKSSIRSDLNRLEAEIVRLKRLRVTDQQADRAWSAFQVRQAKLVRSADDLKDAIEPVQARYQALSKDAELKKATDALKATSRVTPRFHSPEFDAAVKGLSELRRAMGGRMPRK
ncbi:MAG: hypothetical protein U0800_19195 [Isosphaeraceae bacterium]